MKPLEDWTIISLLQWTTAYFTKNGIASPRMDAELLLAHALGMERIDLYLRHDQPLNSDELQRFRGLIKRRAAREPVAYITGTKEFWSLALEVGPAVLIPRPETECVVEAALDYLKTCTVAAERRFLDLGTGCGALALALAHSCPEDRVVAVDRSCEALAVSRTNCRRLALQERVQLVAGDWLDMFADRKAWVDLMVSNPPYIPSAQIDGLQPEITRYEPRMALDGGADGLACLGRIVNQAPALLKSGGALYLEIGHDQFQAVRRLAEKRRAYKAVTCRPDYSGLDRVACLVRA